jgi:hypothetical protein
MPQCLLPEDDLTSVKAGWLVNFKMSDRVSTSLRRFSG